MSVVIAGCGDLGTEVGLRCAARGHRVLGLRRTAEKLPPEIDGRSIDLAAEVPELPADTSIVMIAMSPDERSVAGYQAAYVDTVNNLAAAITRDCTVPPRVLYVSSTAVYGTDDGSWIDETTPAHPSTATAAVLRTAEETLLDELPAATIIRLGGIYGPGRTRQIDRIREGVETLSLQPRFTNLIHRDDAAGAIVHLLTMHAHPQTIYIGVDNRPSDQQEITEFLARSLAVPLPPPADESEVTARGGGKRCSNRLLRHSGFDFTYPTYREGYAAVLAGAGVRHP